MAKSARKAKEEAQEPALVRVRFLRNWSLTPQHRYQLGTVVELEPEIARHALSDPDTAIEVAAEEPVEESEATGKPAEGEGDQGKGEGGEGGTEGDAGEGKDPLDSVTS